MSAIRWPSSGSDSSASRDAMDPEAMRQSPGQVLRALASRPEPGTVQRARGQRPAGGPGQSGELGHGPVLR